MKWLSSVSLIYLKVFVRWLISLWMRELLKFCMVRIKRFIQRRIFISINFVLKEINERGKNEPKGLYSLMLLY